MVFDLVTWISKATLDAMGLGMNNSLKMWLYILIHFSAAFDYHFKTLDNADDELGNAYANLWLVFTTSIYL